MGLMAWEGLYVLFTVDDVTPAERKVLTDPSTDMALAVGPVFVTQTNPTHHFFNPTHRQLNIPDPIQPIDDKYSVAYHHKCNFTKYLIV